MSPRTCPNGTSRRVVRTFELEEAKAVLVIATPTILVNLGLITRARTIHPNGGAEQAAVHERPQVDVCILRRSEAEAIAKQSTFE